MHPIDEILIISTSTTNNILKMKLKIIKKKLVENITTKISFKTEDLPPSRFLPNGGYKVTIEENGENAGDIEVQTVDEDKVYVSTIWIRQRFRGKALGTKLYEEAVREAKNRGKQYFCSDSKRSLAAETFWSKQLNKDRVNVQRDDEGNVRYCLNLSNITQVDLSEEID